MRRSLSLCAAAFFLAAPSRSAFAQTPPSPPDESAPDPTPAPAPTALGDLREDRWIAFDLDQVYSTESSARSPYLYPVADSFNSPPTTYYFISNVLGARLHLSNLELDAEIPFALAHAGGGDGVGAVFGDVAFAAYYLHGWRNLRLRVGGIFSLPTSPGQTTGVAPYPLNFGLYGSIGTASPLTYRGFDRPWLWANHYFTPIAPSARIASDEESVLQHATELVVAPLVGVDPGDPVAVAAQLSEELAAHVSIFRGGARFEAAGVFGPGDPSGAISVAPFAALEGKRGFGEIGPIVNVHEWTRGVDEGTAHWGLRLRGGLSF